ncbi:hypothetical protein AYO45_00855 [Gammaproteobacteria bacterium SCGC AG-212-F23]|nr:hypothetical protein AYO45_00855 [Gammaproteobacteria bacterium SCGC AG-212-F23]
MKRIHLLMIMLVMTLFFLQYRLWFESGGMIDVARLKKQYLTVVQETQILKERNQKLLMEVKQLQNGGDAMESNARHELGMIKKGETFYQVVDKDK